MAITIGHNNQRINDMINQKFVHPNRLGLHNEDNFVFSYIPDVYTYYWFTYYGSYYNGSRYNLPRWETYYTSFAIMSGEKPDPENTGTPYHLSNDSRTLMHWRHNSNDSNMPLKAVNYTDHIQLTPEFFYRENAIRSGEATWFIIQTDWEHWERYVSYRSRYGSTSYSDRLYQTPRIDGIITGTVGPIGSGADLQLLDTNIVSGRQHQIPYGFKIFRPVNKSVNS